MSLKKYILLLALVAANTCYAQHAYIPVPADSAFWLTQVEDWHEGENPPPPHSFYYMFGQFDGIDTIVNGKKYACYAGDVFNTDLPFPYAQHYALDGQLIRQDTIVKKIWYMRDKSHPNKEELLYDFSLQAGDTITDTNSSYFSPNELYPYKAWIDQLDSVYWTDGLWHYRWWIKSDFGPIADKAHTVQIEGMGYINNFLDNPFAEFYPLVGNTKLVICYKVKSQWLYEQPNHWNFDCDSMIKKNALDVPDISGNDLAMPMLYPNPVSNRDRLYLNQYAGNASNTYHISAYDISGSKVLSMDMKPGAAIDLSKYQLGQGLYFFVVENGVQRVSCEKVLIE
ncbi:MAG: T9SS type A sorting domain-containing protein [Bacteroidetes bacterium]|nr:T9SS type A sorting domain-containing protein [Bacteroidota bacterium]